MIHVNFPSSKLRTWYSPNGKHIDISCEIQHGICPSSGSGSGGLKNDNIYAYFHEGRNVNWLMVERLRNKIYIPFRSVSCSFDHIILTEARRMLLEHKHKEFAIDIDNMLR